jgi:glycosyltransferase involved in cell wall biosynthesis
MPVRAPEVSVVIATRNRRSFLPTVLRSALGQQDVELEVIVVDDGSDDDTAEVLAGFEDPRLQVLRNPLAHGVARARNRGIDHARAPWIAFLDDDDLWSPEKLRVQLALAREREAAVVYARAIVIDGAGRPRRLLAVPDDGLVAARLSGVNIVGSPSGVLARADALRAEGGFDPSFSILADWDLWLRLEPRGPIVGCGDVLLAYTEHREGMSRNIGAVLEEFEQLREKHRGRFADPEQQLGDKHWWRWIASLYRADGHRVRAGAIHTRLASRERSLGELRSAVQAVALPPGREIGTRPPALPGWLAAQLGEAAPTPRAPSPPRRSRSSTRRRG